MKNYHLQTDIQLSLFDTAFLPELTEIKVVSEAPYYEDDSHNELWEFDQQNCCESFIAEIVAMAFLPSLPPSDDTEPFLT